MRVLALIAALVAAGCAFGEERTEVATAPDPCARPGSWSTWPEAAWVRRIVETGGYRVTAQTAAALVASGKGHEFYIWTSEGRAARMPNTRRLAAVRRVPVYGDRDLWRYWYAQGFTFWVQSERAPAAGRLAPVVDASLRLPFRHECRA